MIYIYIISGSYSFNKSNFNKREIRLFVVDKIKYKKLYLKYFWLKQTMTFIMRSSEAYQG